MKDQTPLNERSLRAGEPSVSWVSDVDSISRPSGSHNRRLSRTVAFCSVLCLGCVRLARNLSFTLFLNKRYLYNPALEIVCHILIQAHP